MKPPVISHNENFNIVERAKTADVGSGDEEAQRFYYQPELKQAGGYDLAAIPPHVDIELTNVCDLACEFCETLVMKRPKGMMSFETFKMVVDQCAEIGVSSAKLNLWGESLLNKKLPQMIEYAKRNSKLVLQFNANANRLGEALSRGIIQAGLDRLTISVDGITKQTYEKLRVNGDYEQVVENIHRLLAIRRELGASNPLVTLQIIRTTENEHEVEPFVEYWKQFADQVSVTNISVTTDTTILRFSLRKDATKGRKPCQQPWQRLSVLWDGSVTVCCKDYEGALKIGDIRTDHLKDLWSGPRITEIRQRHAARSFDGMICSSCTDSFAYEAGA